MRYLEKTMMILMAMVIGCGQLNSEKAKESSESGVEEYTVSSTSDTIIKSKMGIILEIQKGTVTKDAKVTLAQVDSLITSEGDVSGSPAFEIKSTEGFQKSAKIKLSVQDHLDRLNEEHSPRYHLVALGEDGQPIEEEEEEEEECSIEIEEACDMGMNCEELQCSKRNVDPFEGFDTSDYVIQVSEDTFFRIDVLHVKENGEYTEYKGESVSLVDGEVVVESKELGTFEVRMAVQSINVIDDSVVIDEGGPYDEGDGIDHSADSDGDGMLDGVDPDPRNPDSDGDGLLDGVDPDPRNPDMDGDGILDGVDPDPYDPDMDDDGLLDGVDLDPYDPDIDDDGVLDGEPYDPAIPR
jgi:hypothetical protein